MAGCVKLENLILEYTGNINANLQIYSQNKMQLKITQIWGSLNEKTRMV